MVAPSAFASSASTMRIVLPPSWVGAPRKVVTRPWTIDALSLSTTAGGMASYSRLATKRDRRRLIESATGTLLLVDKAAGRSKDSARQVVTDNGLSGSLSEHQSSKTGRKERTH